MMENTQQVQNPASQSPPVQSAEQKPYSKKNWIKWILVAFFLILLIAIPAFAYYLYLQNPFNRNLKGYIRGEENLRNRLTPIPSLLPTSTSNLSSESTNSASTANWKTYTQRAFSFQYPSTMTVKTTALATDNPEWHLNIEENGKSIGALIVNKKDYKYMHNLDLPAEDISLDRWMRWNRYIRDDLPDQICTIKTYGILSGFDCNLNPYGSESFNFVTKTNGRFITITLTDGGKANLEQFQKILSTFKFTE